MEVVTDISSLRQRLNTNLPSVLCQRWAICTRAICLSCESLNRKRDCLVVSIFVNRLQFGPTEDFERYPRTLADDCKLLENRASTLHSSRPKQLYPVKQEFMV